MNSGISPRKCQITVRLYKIHNFTFRSCNGLVCMYLHKTWKPSKVSSNELKDYFINLIFLNFCIAKRFPEAICYQSWKQTGLWLGAPHETWKSGGQYAIFLNFVKSIHSSYYINVKFVQIIFWKHLILKSGKN